MAKSPRSSTTGVPSKEQPSARLARGPVGVGSLVSRLTRPVLGSRGFADADVIAHWPTIVGPELTALACPLSLKYERASQRSGATLMIRVASGAAATLLQFKAPQIVERVNHYFGYQAVAKLQISLGALPQTAKAAAADETPLPPAIQEEIAQTVATVGSSTLRQALSQLGAAVRRRAVPTDDRVDGIQEQDHV